MTRDDGASGHLTPREYEVLCLVGEGLSSKQVAARLAIAPKTVEGYIDHMRLKLGAHNRCHMIFLATARGLLAEDGRDRSRPS